VSEPGLAPKAGIEDLRLTELVAHYRDDLARLRDEHLMSTDPAVLAQGINDGLNRLFAADRLAPDDEHSVRMAILGAAVGYGAIDLLLADASITEIMVNGTDPIVVERDGRLVTTAEHYLSERDLVEVIRRMAASIGRSIDEVNPMVDARLPDGSRINGVIRPASVNGPALTIRKFAPVLVDLPSLVEHGTVSAGLADFLAACVRARFNILISGGTGCGKTTTLNILAGAVPADQRLITIEDCAELHIPHPNVVSLEYRPPNVEGTGELSVRQLLKNSLRMRPDRIIVGEVRGAEAFDMLQAMNTGHDGSMSTIHANSASDAITRLETMALSGSADLPIQGVRSLIASGVDLVVHQARLADGSRQIVQIAELTTFPEEGPVFLDLYRAGDRGAPGGLSQKLLDKAAFYGSAIGQVQLQTA
jgi:pilus assembly protein CpaF